MSLIRIFEIRISSYHFYIIYKIIFYLLDDEKIPISQLLLSHINYSRNSHHLRYIMN